MRGCLRPWKNAAKHIVWLEKRLLKFWLKKTPPEIKKVGELWGRGQIQIKLESGEWHGRIKKCEFQSHDGTIAIHNKTVTLTVTLCWFAHKKVTEWQDEFLINRRSCTWDRILHPYELILTLTNVQQTKIKPRRLYFETLDGESGYFSLRNDPENVSWKKKNIRDPLLK